MPTYFEVINRIYMPAILRRIKERENEMEKKKKVRAKHIGFSGQREFCRNNDHTYTEKFGGEQVLMCNYPFPDIHHRKGVCRANTCTDMREIPAEITEADAADVIIPPLTDPVVVERVITHADENEEPIKAAERDVPTCEEVEELLTSPVLSDVEASTGIEEPARLHEAEGNQAPMPEADNEGKVAAIPCLSNE
jgi:hypothetical protein